jgi:hypothetical protein
MHKAIAAICVFAAATMQTGACAGPSLLELALRDEARPTITRAIDVVNEGSPREVTSGEDVVFSARVGAEGVLREGFQVRIFTLPSLSSDPVEATQPVEDCLVYFSTVYPVASTGGPKIQLVSNASEGWLSVQPDKTVGNGYYLLVFERTGVRESVFRIKRGDASAYFATGIKLVVKAHNKSRLDEVIAKNATREAQRVADADKLTLTDNKIPCYRYEKVTKFAGLPGAPEQLAALTCENPQHRPA